MGCLCVQKREKYTENAQVSHLIGSNHVSVYILKDAAAPFHRRNLQKIHLTGCFHRACVCDETRQQNVSKELHLLDLEGDTLGNSNADGGPQHAVSTDLPLSAVLHHSPKET